MQAKDFGTRGHTFPIQEESLLKVLQKKLSSLSPDEIAQFEEKLHQHFIAKAKQPVPLQIEEATIHKTYFFDPSIEVSKDIVDHLGNVIVKKGTLINPLAIASLTTEILFFDGSKEEHLIWARTFANAKWVLVKGCPLQLEEQEGKPVYFDQNGFITQKWGIEHIPAKVFQEKGSLKLTIEEIPVCKS